MNLTLSKERKRFFVHGEPHRTCRLADTELSCSQRHRGSLRH